MAVRLVNASHLPFTQAMAFWISRSDSIHTSARKTGQIYCQSSEMTFKRCSTFFIRWDSRWGKVLKFHYLFNLMFFDLSPSVTVISVRVFINCRKQTSYFSPDFVSQISNLQLHASKWSIESPVFLNSSHSLS